MERVFEEKHNSREREASQAPADTTLLERQLHLGEVQQTGLPPSSPESVRWLRHRWRSQRLQHEQRVRRSNAGARPGTGYFTPFELCKVDVPPCRQSGTGRGYLALVRQSQLFCALHLRPSTAPGRGTAGMALVSAQQRLALASMLLPLGSTWSIAPGALAGVFSAHLGEAASQRRSQRELVLAPLEAGDASAAGKPYSPPTSPPVSPAVDEGPQARLLQLA
jgi:hypothetical protein